MRDETEMLNQTLKLRVTILSRWKQKKTKHTHTKLLEKSGKQNITQENIW